MKKLSILIILCVVIVLFFLFGGTKVYNFKYKGSKQDSVLQTGIDPLYVENHEFLTLKFKYIEDYKNYNQDAKKLSESLKIVLEDGTELTPYSESYKKNINKKGETTKIIKEYTYIIPNDNPLKEAYVEFSGEKVMLID